MGVLYALPLELRVTGIMYRKDLLDAAGIEPPRTLDELAEVAGELRPEDGVGIAVGFSPAKPDAGMDWFVPTLIGLGSKPLNEDGSANFDTPEMRKLLSWIHGLVHEKQLIPLDVALLGDNDVQLYADSGKTVFLPKMTHRLETIRKSSGLGDAYQMMDALTFDADHPAPAYLQGWNLLIPTGSAHPDLAWKLIEHWTSPEIQLYQAENAGYIPVRSSVAQDPALADRGHIQWALAYANEAPLEFEWPENYFALYTTLAEMVSEVISDRMTIDEAIAAAEESYDSR